MRSVPPDLRVYALVGNFLIEPLPRVHGLRAVRTALIQLAYSLATEPTKQGVLLLLDARITIERLRQEWTFAASILKPELLKRLSISLEQNGRLIGIPEDPPSPAAQAALREVLTSQPKTRVSRPVKVDAAFVVRKILLNQWFTKPASVTAGWLTTTAGLSYPTVAHVIHGLGSLIERTSDRRIRLRWFPREELQQMVAISDRARSTVRYADRSGGQSRPVEAHLKRLERLNLPGLAIGGVMGAKHYYRDLDLVGSPRLDLSLHAPGAQMDLSFVQKLDPGLQRIEDPLEPAALAIHAVRHADSLFAPRAGGLHWADRVECLLDLHEARLETQANQFLDALKKSRPSTP